MNKKGEISTAWLITVIFIIAGLVILFILLSRFVRNSEISKETCHESVIFRATMPAEVKSYSPLKCKTAKYCLTTKIFGTASCSEYAGVEKEVTTVRVKDRTAIEQFMAREMLDCWSMMGEGKVSLFTQYFAETYGFGSVYPSCTICSRIAFDAELKKKEFIKKVDLGWYMRTHKVPGKEISYADYFASENGQISVGEKYNFTAMKTDLKDLASVEKISEEAAEGIAEFNKNPEATTISENQDKYLSQAKDTQAAIVFMQITAPDKTESLKNLVSDVLGIGTVSFFVAPTLTLKTIWRAGTGVAKHPVIAAVLVVAGISFQQYSVAANRAVTAGYCGDVAVGKEARDGCSVVRLVNYNLREIAQYCQAVESIP